MVQDADRRLDGLLGEDPQVGLDAALRRPRNDDVVEELGAEFPGK